MTIDLASELLGSGAPTLKFVEEGDTHSITIRGFDKRQATEFGTGEPAFWNDGNPKYQYVITGESNGEEARLFLKAYGSQKQALMDALRKAEAQPGEDMTGWTLTIKWASTEKPTKPGLSGARQFVAKLERPKAIVDIDLI